MNPILFYIHKKQNPILWSKTSEAFLTILSRYAPKTGSILEVGSGTGHVSYMLVKNGYAVTLNEIRKETLEESQHRFQQHRAVAQYLRADVFKITKKYDFLWNSGLIQCFPDTKKHTLVKQLAKISKHVLLFYPDTTHPKKEIGKNTKNIPGVDDAKEYPIANIPTIMLTYFDKLTMGTLTAEEIGLPYPMYWVYGELE